MSSFIKNYELISTLGKGKKEHLSIFDQSRKSLSLHTLENEQTTLVARVTNTLPQLPEQLKPYNSRNNRLLLTAVEEISEDIEQIINLYGRHRIAIIIGTSTSGISDVENAFEFKKDNQAFPDNYDYKQHEMGSPSEFLKKHLNITGPSYTISCACSSGAKALAAADRLLESNLCDAVIAGGVDTLCNLTLSGFSSLNVMSEKNCNPFSVNRDGINIGEAAALFVMTREPGPLKLEGYGESSDAHHHSAPHPDGDGAISSMSKALKHAQLTPENIDYINLHGTGTKQNDSMEAKAVNNLFSQTLPCSSTKSLTGHTLGAAGALEAAFCCLALEENKLPLHHWDGQHDPDMPALNFVSENSAGKVRTALSNSFAFGGNNCSLIFGVVND